MVNYLGVIDSLFGGIFKNLQPVLMLLRVNKC